MAQPIGEFSIFIPPKEELKKFSIMKFAESLNVDTTKWTDGAVTMEREDNRATAVGGAAPQDYGEGSEYGRAAREEARRKKYGRQSKNYRIDDQPWNLTIKSTDGKERRLRSIREGGAGEHADYWVFVKTGDSEFQAHKVSEWHKFLPAVTHRVLDADQAEEQFQRRAKVMNQFALKAQIQQQLRAQDDDEEQLEKSKNLKIKDEFSSDDEEESGGEEAGSEARVKKLKKKKRVGEPKKDKRQRVENADEVAAYESEDGEDEGREYDYMSDSGSDTDREEVPVEEKVDKELVAVGDETGLQEESDSDSDEEDSTKKLLRKASGKGKDRENMDIDERDSSGSDTDDPDKEKIESVMLLPSKKATEDVTTAGNGGGAKKRAADEEAEGANGAKKPKTEAGTSKETEVEGLNEATVRKYLRRKPHTTKELVTKMKPKCGDMPKQEIVSKLAAILKQISPHQFKQKQGNKEILFFSLSNTV